MQRPSKRHRDGSATVPSSPRQLQRLTEEQETSVFVSALRNVVGCGLPADMWTTEFFISQALQGNTAVNTVADQGCVFLPIPAADTCQFCKINGCLGCNFFPPNQEDVKSNKINTNTTNTSTNTGSKRKKKNYRGVRHGRGGSGRQRSGIHGGRHVCGWGRSRQPRRPPVPMTGRRLSSVAHVQSSIFRSPTM